MKKGALPTYQLNKREQFKLLTLLSKPARLQQMFSEERKEVEQKKRDLDLEPRLLHHLLT